MVEVSCNFNFYLNKEKTEKIGGSIVLTPSSNSLKKPIKKKEKKM